MVPVMMMPVVVPMMVMPVVMVPVMVIVHLDRLHAVDFVLRHDSLLDACGWHAHRLARERRQGRSLRACGEHNRARDQSST